MNMSLIVVDRDQDLLLVTENLCVTSTKRKTGSYCYHCCNDLGDEKRSWRDLLVV